MQEHSDAWRDLNRRYKALWIAAGVAVVALITGRLGWLGLWGELFLMTPALAAIVWLVQFDCPRCGKSFSGLDKYLSIPGGGGTSWNECAYCHLKRGT